MATTSIRLEGLPKIAKKLGVLEDTPFARKMMGEIGMFSMFAIKKRTIKGSDVDGIKFKPYNPLYAKERVKKGYKSSPVDLTRTGSMMASMTYESTRNSTNIFFMNTSDPSGAKNPAKAFWLNEDREFFALSKEDIKGIIDIVNDFYERYMRS